MDLKLTFCNFKSIMRFCLKTGWNRCNHNKPHFKQSDLNRGSGGAHFHSSVIERRWNHVQFPLGLLQNHVQFPGFAPKFWLSKWNLLCWMLRKNDLDSTNKLYWELKPRDIEILFFKIISRTNSRWRAISWVFFFFFFFVWWKNYCAAAAAGTMALYACLVAAEDFRAAAVAVSCAHRYGGKKCQSCDWREQQ